MKEKIEKIAREKGYNLIKVLDEPYRVVGICESVTGKKIGLRTREMYNIQIVIMKDTRRMAIIESGPMHRAIKEIY